MRRRSALLLLIFASVIVDASSAIAKQAPVAKGVLSSAEKPMTYRGQNAITISQELISKQDYTGALKQVEVAISSDPKSGIPYMVKAFLLDQTNQSKKAGEAFKKAVSLSPTNGFVLNSYAVYACEKGRFDEADSYFMKAAVHGSFILTTEAFENAAQCSLKNNDFKLSESRARTALDLSPESVSALETLIFVEVHLGSFMEARAFMQRREALGPLDVSLLEIAQQIEKAAGDERAAAQYKKQLDLLEQAQIPPPTGEGQKKP